MCSLDGRSGTNTGALPGEKNERAWKEGMGILVVLLLAERARSECARSTRAIEDQPGYPVSKKLSELGSII